MSTRTTNCGFILPSSGDTNYGPMVDGDFTSLDSMSSVGSIAVQTTEVPSTTLNVKIAAGNIIRQDGSIATYAGLGSKTLTASTTNFLYLDQTAGGVLTVNATGFPTTAHTRIATVVTGTTTVTSIADARVTYQVVGTFVDGVNLTFGTTTGTQIGTAVTQKLALWGASPVVQPAGAAQAALTNSTGGTAGTTLTAVTATNSTDQSATLNNNISSLNNLIEAMRTALVAAGIMKGSA